MKSAAKPTKLMLIPVLAMLILLRNCVRQMT
jgi:hypothetical protein